MAHVGFHVTLGRVYALPRVLRALDYKKNLVPASMLTDATRQREWPLT